MALGTPVGEMLARMTSRELTEWMAFYQLEPFGPERGDLQAGIVASVVANANRDSKKQKKPFTPQDFMPEFEGPVLEKEGKTPEQLRQKWEMVVAAFAKKS